MCLKNIEPIPVIFNNFVLKPFRHQREVDKRRARMCLRQKQREKDYQQKKAEKQQDVSMAVKV